MKGPIQEIVGNDSVGSTVVCQAVTKVLDGVCLIEVRQPVMIKKFSIAQLARTYLALKSDKL
jgi:hypothetical protein